MPVMYLINMEWSTILDYFFRTALAGAGALIFWLVKFYIPALNARKDKQLEASLKTQEAELTSRLKSADDTREYKQATENVAIDILQEMIRERSRELDEFTKAITASIDGLSGAIIENTKTQENNGKRISQAVAVNRTLAGIIEEKLAANPAHDP